jgi:SAM-dependent methyltransferase
MTAGPQISEQGVPPARDETGYALPADYRPNGENRTLDSASGTHYWTPWRLRISGLYQAAVYAYAAKLIGGNPRIRTVVDVGCGPAVKLSRIAHRFPDRVYYGLDQEDPIAHCQRTYAFGTWLAEDFEAPRQLDRLPTADLVICADVIEHMPDPDRLLSYIARISSTQTLILLSTPDRAKLVGPHARRPSNEAHIREWAFEEFRAYLESRGFDVLRHRRSVAVGPALDSQFVREAIGRLRRLRTLNYNQLCLVRKPD